MRRRPRENPSCTTLETQAPASHTLRTCTPQETASEGIHNRAKARPSQSRLQMSLSALGLTARVRTVLAAARAAAWPHPPLLLRFELPAGLRVVHVLAEAAHGPRVVAAVVVADRLEGTHEAAHARVARVRAVEREEQQLAARAQRLAEEQERAVAEAHRVREIEAEELRAYIEKISAPKAWSSNNFLEVA